MIAWSQQRPQHFQNSKFYINNIFYINNDSD